MEYYEPKKVAGSFRATLPVDVLNEGEKSWTTVIVAQFVASTINNQEVGRGYGFFGIQYDEASCVGSSEQCANGSITKKGLSYIASVLGKPLSMDQITMQRERLAYSRVCIELEAGKEISHAIEMELRNGKIVWVQDKVQMIEKIDNVAKEIEVLVLVDKGKKPMVVVMGKEKSGKASSSSFGKGKSSKNQFDY
ncbi:hypothetical protein PTKIN_Ptkin09bG0121400 [Pterospermum kingtungense]